MAERPVLVCIEGSLAGRRFAIPDGGLEIGRAPENGVVLTDPGVSRFHARLLYDNGSLWVKDAGSRNGVMVNDLRIPDHKALGEGDVLVIAESRFRVEMADASQVWDDTETERTVAPDLDTTEQAPTEKPARSRWYWPFG